MNITCETGDSRCELTENIVGSRCCCWKQRRKKTNGINNAPPLEKENDNFILSRVMQFRVKNAKQLAPSFAFECGQGARENSPPLPPPCWRNEICKLETRPPSLSQHRCTIERQSKVNFSRLTMFKNIQEVAKNCNSLKRQPQRADRFVLTSDSFSDAAVAKYETIVFRMEHDS